MDRRHLLEVQRSQMAAAAHQGGLPTTSFRAPPLPVRSPLSPMMRQQLPQMPHGLPPHMFPARLPHVPPHLTFDNPLSSQLLERQRELKEVSLMQAKLAQQRSMLAYPVPHVAAEDRIQFVPAIPSNMSPEDSLAQLRRLHQQVLSMPAQEPHFYDIPLPAGFPRDSKEAQEVELLRFSAKERLLLMEKQLQNAKQHSAARELEGAPTSHYGSSRMAQLHHQVAFPGRPRSPVGRASTSRPSPPNRSSMFGPSEVMSHEQLNRSLRESLSTESGARMAYEVERAAKKDTGPHQKQYLRHDHLAFYHQQQQQASGPCPNAVVIPREVPTRSHPGLRSPNLHAPSYYPHVESRVHGRPSSVERKQSPEVPPTVRSASAGYSLPQIKSVKSLAASSPSGEAERKFVHSMEQRRLWMMKIVENKIKQELDKDEEPRPHSSNSIQDAHASAITKVPSTIHPATSGTKSVSSIGVHGKQLSSPSPKPSPPLSPKEFSLPQRKRAAPLEDTLERPRVKRSRGSGDTLKARLADYVVPPGGRVDGAVAASTGQTGAEKPTRGTPEQPLDLSVNGGGKSPDPLGKASSPPDPRKDPRGAGGIPLIREGTTISDIISQAVLASLEKPFPREGLGPDKRRNIPDRVADETSSSSSVPIAEDKGSVPSAGVSPVPDEGGTHNLIEHLSTEFAGSFKHFLASLLHQCNDKGYEETLALHRAGQRIPHMMKEELERCDLKISQTIRALLSDEKGREGCLPTDEARVEKDTSPPCQVTTTTDILQHNSPPSSPLDRKTPSASRGLPKETEVPEVEEIPLEIVPGGYTGVSIPVAESSPASDRRGEEEIQSVRSPPPSQVDVEPILMEEEPSDIPLCIDEGETCQPDEKSGDLPREGETLPVKAEKIEEDAIDCLIFGNELIDSGPLRTECSVDVSRTREEEARDSGARPDGEHQQMRLPLGSSQMSLDSGEPTISTGSDESPEVTGDNKNSGLESDADAIGDRIGGEDTVSKPNDDCRRDVHSGSTGLSAGSRASEEKVIPGVSTEDLDSTAPLPGVGDVHCESKEDHTSEAQTPEEGACDSEVQLGVSTENTNSSCAVGASGMNRSDSILGPVTVGISGGALPIKDNLVNPLERVVPSGEVDGRKEMKAITPEAAIKGITSQTVRSGVPSSSPKVSNRTTNLHSLPKRPLLPRTLSPTTPPVTTMIPHSPITLTLPKVYQLTQVPSSPPVFAIVTTQNTTNIGGIGSIMAPTISTPGLSAAAPTLIVQSNQPVVATLKPPRGIVSSPATVAGTSVQLVNPLLTPVCSPSVQGSSTPPPVAGPRVQSPAMPGSPSTSSSPPAQTSKKGPAPPAQTNPSKWWMGNELIPNSVSQEQPKKPSVPAYTVVYLAARLPCVVRSSVPFVPPKILWASLFPEVTFGEFNRALSACLILQRYMTVMEQAALQKDLASNDISSCKLVPLDEFDKNYSAVRAHLNRTPAAAEKAAGKSSGDCLQS